MIKLVLILFLASSCITPDPQTSRFNNCSDARNPSCQKGIDSIRQRENLKANYSRYQNKRRQKKMGKLGVHSLKDTNDCKSEKMKWKPETGFSLDCKNTRWSQVNLLVSCSTTGQVKLKVPLKGRLVSLNYGKWKQVMKTGTDGVLSIHVPYNTSKVKLSKFRLDIKGKKISLNKGEFAFDVPNKLCSP